MWNIKMFAYLKPYTRRYVMEAINTHHIHSKYTHRYINQSVLMYLHKMPIF